VSYADGIYVALSGKDLNNLKTRIEHTMTTHDNYLNSIGMVTNVDKTELSYFTRHKIEGPSLLLNSKPITPSETIKVTDEMIKVATSHFYRVLYYAVPVWLTSFTKSIHWKLLNSIHYRAMRIVIGDIFNQISHKDIDKIGSTPHQWMLYYNSKMAITLKNLSANGPRLSDKLVKLCHVNDRIPGVGTFQDYSRLKIGRNSLVNRLPMLRKVRN